MLVMKLIVIKMFVLMVTKMGVAQDLVMFVGCAEVDHRIVNVEKMLMGVPFSGVVKRLCLLLFPHAGRAYSRRAEQ